MLNKLKEGHWPIFILTSFSSVANLFLPIILVRLLSPHDMGIYKIFFLYLSVLPFIFFTGSPSNAVYYYIGKPAETRDKYIQSTWILIILLSFFTLIVGLPFSSLLAQKLDFPVRYVYYLLFSSFFWIPGTHFIETCIARGKTAIGSLYDTFWEVVKVVGVIFIAWTYKNLDYVFIYFLTLLIIKFFVTIILSKKTNSIALILDYPKLREVFFYCLPIALSGLLGIVVDKVDMLILSTQLNPAHYAFYSMGCLAIPPLYLLEMSVNKVLIPRLSENYQKKQWKLAAENFKKAISDVAFLIIPSAFGLYFFAEPIVRLLYTDQYMGSVIYLKIFAISYLLFMIPIDSVPRASGHTNWIFKMYLIVAPISLVTVYLCAKYFGAEAALIASISIKVIPRISGLFYSKFIMNWTWSEMIPVKKILFFTILSAILSLISLCFKPYFKSDLIWFFTCGGLFALIYLGVLYIPTYRNDKGK